MRTETASARTTPVHPSVEDALSHLLAAALADADAPPPTRRSPRFAPAAELRADDALPPTARGE